VTIKQYEGVFRISITSDYSRFDQANLPDRGGDLGVFCGRMLTTAVNKY